MKTNNNIPYLSKIVILMITCLSFVSCNSFLEEHSQDLAYIRTLDDLDQLLLGSAYMEVKPRTPLKYENFYIPFIHYISDETEEIIGETRYNPRANIRPKIFGYYTWQQSVGLSFDGTEHQKENTDWLRFYNHISTINIILDEVDKIEAITQKDKTQQKRIKAEASFLRGVYYFILVNLYAEPYSHANLEKKGVPLKLANHIEDKNFTRATIQETYQLIVSDLELSAKLMVDMPPKSKYRISEAGLRLFLSRVYLYMQKWEMAAENALKSIELNPYIENLHGWANEKYFQTIENREVLFSMGGSLLFSHLNSSCPTGCFQASKELYNLYPDHDLRKTVFFVKEKTDCSKDNTVILPIKQNPRGPYRGEVSDVFCLRSAEAYLNLSEAYAMQNKLDKSCELLNKLMQMRIKHTDFNPLKPTSQEEIVKIIRDERKKELCFEGHRWFDIRRYRVNELFPEKKDLHNTYTIYSKSGRISKMQTTYVYTLPADEDLGYVLPIPIEEKNINSLIKDNNRIERRPGKTIKYE